MAIIHVSAEAANGTKTYITAGGHRIEIDEPPLFGGEDSAPSPVAMLLASLAGCVNAIGQWVAKEMDFAIGKLTIDIDGDIDSSVFLTGGNGSRSGFKSIAVAIRLEADIPDDQRGKWLAQVKARCPVIDTIMKPTSVAFELRDGDQR